MNIWLWVLIAVITAVIVFCIVMYFVARYFFRFTILRKKPATLDNNINANTDWHKHLDFIGQRKEWLSDKELIDCCITSFDGLSLKGHMLMCAENSNKYVICFHGYTSCGLTNFGAYAKFYYENNINMLMVDARAHGDSDGKYIGFGVLDRLDAERWIDFVLKEYGEDIEIYLHGVSMGGATVLMTSGLKLPENVKGIIADCAFTSAYDVFSYILKRDYKLPRFPLMNITDMMTKKYAGYGYKDISTIDELKRCEISVLFIHGDKDDFVPVYMTEQNFEACNSKKTKLIVKNADHAEAYYCDRLGYEKAVLDLINS